MNWLLQQLSFKKKGSGKFVCFLHPETPSKFPMCTVPKIFDWAKTEKATMATYNWCVAYSVQVILFYQFHVLKLHAEIKIKM